MLSSTVWIIGLTCLMLGGVLGAFFTRMLNPGEQKSRELELHLQESQNNFKAYQGQVEEHFRQTADLVGSLTETYRDVHNHLAEGAQQLCETGAGGPVLTRLTETEEHAGDSEPGHAPTPPLDYAPKNNPFEKGVLTEDFGLEKHSVEEQHEEAPNNTP